MTTCTNCHAETETYLCGDCVTTLDTALGDLAGLIDDVATTASKQARVYRGAGKPRDVEQDWRGGDHALIRTPWAVDLDASSLLHRAGNTLTTWARHLVESRGVAALLHRRTQIRFRIVIVRNRAEWRAETIDRGRRPLSDLIAWLRDHLDTIALDEAAAVMLAEITRLRDDLQRAVDRRPSRIYAGPCHALIDVLDYEIRSGTVYTQLHRGARCDRQLYAMVNPWQDRDAEDDDAKIVCDGWRPDGRRADDHGCGATYTAAERVDWLMASIDDALLPLDVWRSSLPKMLDHLTWPNRSWWSRLADDQNPRRQIAPKGLAFGDVELFRGGDIVDYVTREQPRIQGNIERAERQRGGRMSA